MDLVEEIYTLTKKFPDSEKFGLVSQMRRSAISIPSNIAEGSRQSSTKEYWNFLLIAFGSGAELETQLLLSKRLRFCSEKYSKQAEHFLEEIMKMLNSLQSKLQ